jgi:hypothetical protein
VPVAVLHLGPVGPDDADRADGGPQADASFTWMPGSDPALAVTQLREAARARVGCE